MFTQELKAFMKKHGISSATKWQTNDQVSPSTIARILNEKNKDIGLNTVLMMITPYGATVDEFLGIGAYSPEAIEKAELAEKIESAIETIEDSVSIDPESAQEVKSALEDAQEYIATEPPAPITACTNCSASLRETVAILTAENDRKDEYISRLLRIVSSLTGSNHKIHLRTK